MLFVKDVTIRFKAEKLFPLIKVRSSSPTEPGAHHQSAIAHLCRTVKNNIKEVDSCPVPSCGKKFTGEKFLLDHFLKKHCRNRVSFVSDSTPCDHQNSRRSWERVQAKKNEEPEICTNPRCRGYSRRYMMNCEPDIEGEICGLSQKEWTTIYQLFTLQLFFGSSSWNVLARCILLAGDVEQNPGPPTFQCQWSGCGRTFPSLPELGRDLVTHARDNICCWRECCFHCSDDKRMLAHVLKHLYLGSDYTFNTLESWMEALPGGEYFPNSDYISLCPPQLRHKMGLLLFDEKFVLRSDVYTELDHAVYLWRRQTENPELFYQEVEEFVKRCNEKGELWEFNSDKWGKNKELNQFSINDEKPSTSELTSQADVYMPKRKVPISRVETTRPELVGNYQSSVKLTLHNCSPNVSSSTTKKRKRDCFSDDSVEDYLFNHLERNLGRCERAIRTEHEILKCLFANEFLSPKCDYLTAVEDKFLHMASYPACTEGTFLYTIFQFDLSNLNFDKPVYYVRYFESGCYDGFMLQVASDIILSHFQTSRDNLIFSQVFNSNDIRMVSDKLLINTANKRRLRADQRYKEDLRIIKEKLALATNLALEKKLSLDFFIHTARKGNMTNLESKKSDDWFIGSNSRETLKNELEFHLLRFPSSRSPFAEKNAFTFTEEIVPTDCSVLDQSTYLNYLPNNHKYELKGKPLRFAERFFTSSSPASFRNRVISFWLSKRMRNIKTLFLSVCQDTIDDHSVCDPDNQTSEKRKRRSICSTIKKKTVTKQMLQMTRDSAEFSVKNCASPMGIFDNYVRNMAESGTVEIQFLNDLKLVAILNDYGDEDGLFKKFDYVYTQRIRTETGYTFLCSCKIYRTLLDGIQSSEVGQFEALDTTNGVKCMHCRYLADYIIPHMDRDPSSDDSHMCHKIKKALESVNNSCIELPANTNTKKFSVLVEDNPSFVSITLNKTTNKYIVTCHNGYCRSKKGAKKTVDSFFAAQVCSHLQVVKVLPENWTDYEMENSSSSEETLVDFDENKFENFNFDVDSGKWCFKCPSSHSAQPQSSRFLAENVRIRDTYSDLNQNCVPRNNGCLQGPKLINPIPDFMCMCKSGWTDDMHPTGCEVFDRDVIIYTLSAPVSCKVYTRLCTNEIEPCKIKWDEGRSISVHCVSKETAAGDEIGWAFVNDVLASGISFTNFCKNRTLLYKMRNEDSKEFMHKDVFIKWWFSWASNMDIDFRKPCPVCKFKPKQLACDGTKVGISFRHASFDFIETPDDPNLVHDTFHRRLDRCFIRTSDAIDNADAMLCRNHLNYLASFSLGELSDTDFLEDNVCQNRTALLRTVLPPHVQQSFDRFLTSMTGDEKVAYAVLLKMLSTTAAVSTLLPLSYLDQLISLLDHLTGLHVNPAGDGFFNISMHKMRSYAPEVRDMIANSMICHKNDQGLEYLPDDIISFLRCIADRASNFQFYPPEEAEVQIGTYDPPKFGRAYYFSESGCKLRNVRKFKIDDEKKSRQTVHDDAPMEFEQCFKKYDRVQSGAKGTTTLFLWFCPNHGHCYGFHMAHAEGRKDPFASLYTHLENPPDDIFYDFACSLNEYCLNRESGYYKNVRCFHDIFHGFSHKCSSAFKSSRLSGFENINSEICEQFNSYVQNIKKSAAHMNQEHFCFYLQFFFKNME